MPKIIIREYDNTKAGNPEYVNFSVVVPGVVKTGKWKDDSGIEHDYGKDENDKSVFDDNGVYECSSQANFVKYIGKVPGKSSAAVACEIIAGSGGTKTEEEWTLAHTAEDRNIYTRVENESHTVGYLKDADWIYTLSKTYSPTAIYTIILNDKVGKDASVCQIGNQIAYELLGLGYNVLYKKLDSDKIKEELEDENFWQCLKDKSNYSFRYVCTGGFYSTEAYKQICNLVNFKNIEKLEESPLNYGRGDAIALVDVDEDNLVQESIVDGITIKVNALNGLNKYTAIFCPKVTYFGDAEVDYENNLTFPASFHYLACSAYARNELNYNEWYAVAGYTRGVCNKQIAGTSFKLGEIAANALQPRIILNNVKYAVNLIVKIRDNYYVWGNRTAEMLHSATDKNPGLIASHFLNIRQLCCTLKQELYSVCKRLTFDPNSDILWGTFCNSIKPILEKMKADQGIADYKIIKVKSDKKALLTAKVRIVPIEAVEDFDISIFLEDSISGISVGTDEA